MQENLDLGARVKKVRDLNRLTKTDFGARIGVSGTSVNNIEKGVTKNPGSNVLANIAREFGISLQWLQNNIGEMLVVGSGGGGILNNNIRGNNNAMGHGAAINVSSVDDLINKVQNLEIQVNSLNKDLQAAQRENELLKELVNLLKNSTR